MSGRFSLIVCHLGKVLLYFPALLLLQTITTTTITMSKQVAINVDNLTVNNLGIFNMITAPTEYPQQYIEQCKDSGDLAKYAYFSEVPVGLIVLQPVVNKAPVALNITILKVLDSYSWDHGVEKTLVQHALDILPKRHLSQCVVRVSPTNTRFVQLLEEMGFRCEESNAFSSLVPGEDPLYVYSV